MRISLSLNSEEEKERKGWKRVIKLGNKPIDMLSVGLQPPPVAEPLLQSYSN